MELKEKQVGDAVLKHLVKKYGKSVEDRRGKRGPDFIVSPAGKPKMQVDCKKSQPGKQAGNGIPDRAVGQMVRYLRKNPLPTFLVVPNDWEKRREQGETGDPWKTQVEESFKFLNLEDKIKVVLLSEMDKLL